MFKARGFLNWLRSDGGSFTAYAAIAFPVLMGLMGFGLDYWSTLSVKSRLDSAADTAAIAGANAAVAYVEANGSSMSGTNLTNGAEQAGYTAAVQAFDANAGAVLTSTPVTPQVAYSSTNGGFSYTVSYSTSRPTGFSGILGVSALGVAGASTATKHPPTYINVYVLIDASQSMGIAANATQMNLLYAATAPYSPDGPGIGCVFGCHVVQYGSASMESIAHANNITLRIDVARAAIYNMTQTAQLNAAANNIQFAVYQMQQNPSTGALITQVYPASGLTSNYADMLSAMGPTNYSVLDLGPNNSGGTGDSNQPSSLAAFAATLPKSGDGSSASSPLNFVFVVTDGTTDVPGSCVDGHCTGAVASSSCDAIKAKGATVGVVYTTYVTIYTHNDPTQGVDARFSDLVEPYVGLIPGNLSSCSSGNGWFYQATDDTALLNAMQSLFASTLSTVRLTQ